MLPSKDEHKQKAEHNEYLVTTLQNPFFDWAVTVTFYAALHYVEAYFRTKSKGYRNHALRDTGIQKDTTLKAIYADYRELENESRNARYDASMIFNQGDVNRLQVHLETIKNLIKTLI